MVHVLSVLFGCIYLILLVNKNSKNIGVQMCV